MKSRIMYIESKAEGLTGEAHIGRVTFSKTGRTIYYLDEEFRSLKGRGLRLDGQNMQEQWDAVPLVRRVGLTDLAYPFDEEAGICKSVRIVL